MQSLFLLLQGSVQRGEAMYTPTNGAAVRRQDCGRRQVHVESRPQHVRLAILSRNILIVTYKAKVKFFGCLMTLFLYRAQIEVGRRLS
jgi:hypothetical protein